jgi:predicted O-methyltransferase YrrM
MVQEQALHTFLLETDRDLFYGHQQGPATPWIDVCALLHLMRRYQPGRFLEVGTYQGHTTRILAQRFPNTSFVTVDPGDQVPVDERPEVQVAEYLPQEQIGELVSEAVNVRVLKRSFQQIDWGDARFDMIFIDGNHFLPHVLDDSLLALRLLASPGVVVWHDYNHIPDVNLALEQLPICHHIRSLTGTWTAFYDTRHAGGV